jgi:hypothetical protein
MKEETYTIIGCARCGDTHPVTFKPFTSGPINVYEWDEPRHLKLPVLVSITHFGMCPNLNEPLLMNTRQPEGQAVQSKNHKIPT